MAIVELNRLTKRYGKRRGIEELTFSIEEGEIFGFIGPNGAGKSTTIRLLLNLIHPTAGSAKVFGKDIVRDSRDIRRDTGYLPSEVHYYDDMKVADLLRYSAGFHGKLDENRMRRLAERLDLDLSRKIADLSFGNRKKVGIVQALLHSPRLLILDEPTGGLDPLMQHVFFDLLKEEQNRGTTIFFSSHILSEVQRMCGRVAIIRDGRLVRVDSVSQLVNSNFKTVVLTFAADAKPRPVRETDLSGVIRQDISGNVQTLLFSGNVRDLLDYARQLPIMDIHIGEPSLEEIFMHEYKSDKEGVYSG
jgi:ABC-2 type transport system ATP-binding protein